MTVGRRAFLGTVATAAAAFAVPSTSASAATTDLDRSVFTALVGRSIRARGHGRSVALTLTEVHDAAGVRPGDRHRYILVFSARATLPDGIYTLAHSSFGTRTLFLSEVGTGRSKRLAAVVDQTPGLPAAPEAT